ncbi:MAG TPA: hypothetical protein VL832_08985 [Puia sp.]|nr:hypothetical protein [Puia sp.]
MKKPTTPKQPAKPRQQPIKKKEDVQRSNDEHIDQDFPGFPHHPSKENTISNGSARAFEATENTRDDEDSDEDNDDLALNKTKY